MQKALLLVDVQNVFLNEKSSFIVENIQKLLEKELFETVVFTQFVNTPGSSFEKIVGFTKGYDSPDIDFPEVLEPHVKNVFQKTRFSGMTDKLVDFLKSQDIQLLFFGGTDTESCVFATMMEAFDKGFTPILIEELTASHVSEEFRAEAIEMLKVNLGEGQVLSLVDIK